MNNDGSAFSYDVRLWKILRNTVKGGSTYTVRWTVAGAVFRRTFTTRKLAESFRAKLVTSAREGEGFDLREGLPAPLSRSRHQLTWFEHACAFVDMKWPQASSRHRKSIAEALAAVTTAFLPDDHKTHDRDQVRRALVLWSFNVAARSGAPVSKIEAPEDIRAAVRWIAANSPALTDLRDARVLRRALDALSVKQDGTAAAPATITRKRSALYSSLQYAVELDLLEANPINKIQWAMPEHTDSVDRRVVANPEQARTLLVAVRDLNPSLVAFFACLYFAGLRPAEARHLRVADCTLPASGWGELLLTGSTQQAGRAWTDSGDVREDRSLKHRASRDVRAVPACPELVTTLRHHIAEFGTGPDGRLFVTRTGRFGRPVAGPYSNPVSPNTYSRVWQAARAKALTESEAASPLARRPYDLRHAAVSLWLNSGVPATQVAEWAGHSVNVLLRVYAKCVYGQDEAAKKRIESALSDASGDQSEM